MAGHVMDQPGALDQRDELPHPAVLRSSAASASVPPRHEVGRSRHRRRSPQHPNNPEPRRTRITLAVITAILAGAARALTGWLLDHLTTGN